MLWHKRIFCDSLPKQIDTREFQPVSHHPPIKTNHSPLFLVGSNRQRCNHVLAQDTTNALSRKSPLAVFLYVCSWVPVLPAVGSLACSCGILFALPSFLRTVNHLQPLYRVMEKSRSTLKYILTVAVQKSSTGLIKTQYRCDYTRDHVVKSCCNLLAPVRHVCSLRLRFHIHYSVLLCERNRQCLV